MHVALYYALQEFRDYQCRIRGIEQPVEPEEDEMPATPKKLKFEEVREQVLPENMRMLFPHEQAEIDELFVELIATEMTTLSLVAAEPLIKICRKLNPNFRVPSMLTVQTLMDEKDPQQRHELLNGEQDRLMSKRYKLLSSNITHWNSRYTMAARVLHVMDAITATFHRMQLGSREEKAKAEALGHNLLCDEEIKVLREILNLLELVVNFTHWAGLLHSPTVSQVYLRVHEMLPAMETYDTVDARDLWRKLDSLIKDSWPLRDIPDVVLISLFLNPACASLSILDDTKTVDGETLLTKAKRLVRSALIDLKEQSSATPMHENDSDISWP
ncbi:hypothetical protein EDD11_008262 [Mortierella claussenii]|nr:hypothetical protein EDD11_008262 [Mortierella claussenii]